MNTELKNYIEREILPQYEAFTDGHDRAHVEMVIRESLHLAREHGADEAMAYVIAAYHDLGIPQGRSTHHLTSAAILASDKQLSNWFTPDQLQIMKEAVEDHRASAAEKPRSIYGCIVADADHFVIPENVIRRTILYGKANYPEMSEEQQIQRAREHMQNKYVSGGYLHFRLNDKRSLDGLARLRSIVADHSAFEALCRKYL